MPAMHHRLLERRFRRADLSALQGVERLAKRSARQSGRITPSLILFDVRADFLEPHWTL